VGVETYREIISDKWLFIIDCATCWIKYCIIPYIVSSFLCFSSIFSFFIVPFPSLMLLSFFSLLCVPVHVYVPNFIARSDTVLMSLQCAVQQQIVTIFRLLF